MNIRLSVFIYLSITLVLIAEEEAHYFMADMNHKMVYIPGGNYYRGTNSDFSFFGTKYEKPFGPQHKVVLTPFYICSIEVTKEQFRKFLKEEKITEEFEGVYPDERKSQRSYFYGPGIEYPVNSVDWFTAQKYCKWLSKKTKMNFRLPTESEWVAACNGKVKTLYWWGNDYRHHHIISNKEQLLTYGPFKNKLQIGKTFPSNNQGVYDMLGNAQEWVSDWYENDEFKKYLNKTLVNPLGPTFGFKKIRKGGRFRSMHPACNAAFRDYALPNDHDSGFRIACEYKPNDKSIKKIYFDEEYLNFNSNQHAKFHKRIKLTKDCFLDMVLIPAGNFVMGSSNVEMYRSKTEAPQMDVEITKSFYAGIFELTQEQYKIINSTNPSEYKGKNYPLTNITFFEAKEYCENLTKYAKNKKLISQKDKFRLPTEVEWEYMCRGSTTSVYFFGDSPKNLREYARYDTINGPQKVGLLKPNPNGLYDILGNTYEWCNDSPWRYPGGKQIEPIKRFQSSIVRAARGGAWNCGPHMSRSAMRMFFNFTQNYNFVGMRVILEIGDNF